LLAESDFQKESDGLISDAEAFGCIYLSEVIAYFELWFRVPKRRDGTIEHPEVQYVLCNAGLTAEQKLAELEKIIFP
jgi:hypothetical protein